MKRVLLVNLKEKHSGTVSPPIGLWSIRTNLPSCETTVVDHALGEKAPLYGPYDTCGISARFSSQHEDMLAEIKRLRPLSSKIVVGGAHAAFLPKGDWTVEPEAVCLNGHGEGFMRAHLGESVRPFQQLDMPSFSKEEIKPYWDLGRPHDRVKTNRWIPIELSRGCGHHCSFCSITSYYGAAQRRDLYRIYDYLRTLNNEYGVEEVQIEDDSFDLEDPWTWLVIEYLNSHGIWWSCPNGLPARSLLSLDRTQWKALRENCWRLSLPFETGSKRTATAMNTRHKFLEWEEAMELTIRLGENNIQTAGFFIIGYPGEEEEDIRMTLSYANSLPLSDRYIYVATPYPGTPLYELAMQEGLLTVKAPALYTELSYRTCLLDTRHGLRASRVNDWRNMDSSFAKRRRDLPWFST